MSFSKLFGTPTRRAWFATGTAAGLGYYYYWTHKDKHQHDDAAREILQKGLSGQRTLEGPTQLEHGRLGKTVEEETDLEHWNREIQPKSIAKDLKQSADNIVDTVKDKVTDKSAAAIERVKGEMRAHLPAMRQNRYLIIPPRVTVRVLAQINLTIKKLGISPIMAVRLREATKKNLVTVWDDDYVFSEGVVDEGDLDSPISRVGEIIGDVDRMRQEAEGVAIGTSEALRYGLRDKAHHVKEELAGRKDQVIGAAEVAAHELKDRARDAKEGLAGRKDQAVGAVEVATYGLRDKARSTKEGLAGRKDQAVGAVEVAVDDTKSILHDLTNAIGGKKDLLVGALETRWKDFFHTEHRGVRETEEALRANADTRVNEAVETLKGKRDLAIGALETTSKTIKEKVEGGFEKMKGTAEEMAKKVETSAKEIVSNVEDAPFIRPVEVIPRDILGRPITEVPTTEEQIQAIRNRASSVAQDIKSDIVYAKDVLEDKGTHIEEAVERKVINDFGDAFRIAAGKAKEKAHQVERGAEDLVHVDESAIRHAEHNLKEFATDIKDTVEQKAVDILETVEHTAEVVKDTTMDAIKQAEPQYKVDIILQHGKELKEKASDILERTEEKLKDVGDTIKEDVLIAKDKVEDASKKVVDVAEEAAHKISKGFGHPVRQLNELVYRLKQEAPLVGEVLVTKVEDGYQVLVKPIKKQAYAAKEKVYESVKEARDYAAREKEKADKTQASYKEQADRLAAQLKKNIKDVKNVTIVTAEEIKEKAEENAIAAAHKLKDTATHSAETVKHAAEKVAAPVASKYENMKDRLYDRVKEARDYAAEQKRQADIEAKVRSNYTEEPAAPEAVDESMDKP